MEKIVETKTCKHCSVSFDITDKDLEFYEKVSPVFHSSVIASETKQSDDERSPHSVRDDNTHIKDLGNGKVKYLIPTPTLCPSCRQQRRLSWRNETKLYRRDCSLTGKSVVSIYSPDKAFITYNQDDWWSDAYNPCDYGRDFDFSKTFFEQFADLQRVVPRITILNGFGENADYGNHSYHNKNSYFVCSCGYVEDCYYCVTMSDCKNCVDCDKVMSSENCYDAIDSRHCYGCMHILNCMNCSDILWGEDLEGCSHCIGCKGVKNGSYYILNEEVEKAAFSEIQKKLEQDIGYRREMYERFLKLKLQVPSKQLQIIHSEKVEQSDKIENSENVSHCFDCINARDMKYCTEMMMEYTADTSYDYDVWGENASQMYEVHCSGAAKNILFSNVVWGGYNMLYSDNCLNNSRNCFGCIGLKNNDEYCILNKQYTKEEYETLVPKIIEHMMKTGEWGEFFPSSMSPFGYNETVAMEYYPISPPLTPPYQGGGEEVPPLTRGRLGGGFNWSTYESPPPKVDKVIPADKLPSNIEDIPDDILNWAIECEVTKKPFRIIQQELGFYRKHHLPIPRRHPDQRHLDRMQLRNPRKLYERTCDKCHKQIQTTYAPERPEIVYCEECYNSEVY